MGRRGLLGDEPKLDLPPVGVGIQPIIADHDLALIRDMGGHPGDKLQIIHKNTE
jgi:hypothetical protein